MLSELMTRRSFAQAVSAGVPLLGIASSTEPEGSRIGVQVAQPSLPRLDGLMAFEREVEAATARGDVAFLDHALADDFAFTHGDDWRTGGKPTQLDTKKSWMDTVRLGMFVSRAVNAQQVEPHGSFVITTGQIIVTLKPPFLNAGKSEYAVWFVRVYRARESGWELASHRTVAESAA